MNIKIRVFGRVQGVNFRHTVKRRADALELTGWVQNEKDGSVTIHAQGREAKLQELHEWIKGSPGLSSVKQTRFTEQPKENHKKFIIHREPFLKDQVRALRNLGRSF